MVIYLDHRAADKVAIIVMQWNPYLLTKQMSFL
jgi:hypothetical protein